VSAGSLEDATLCYLIEKALKESTQLLVAVFGTTPPRVIGKAG